MANSANEVHIKEEIDISNDECNQSNCAGILQNNCLDVKLEVLSANGDSELEVLRVESPKISSREMRLNARKAMEPVRRKRAKKAKPKPKPKPKALANKDDTITIEEIVGCRNRNQFCYICGLFTPPNNARNLTKNLLTAFEKYFAVTFKPNEGYIPDVACDYCYRGLMGWKNKSERHKIKYIKPVTWLHQTEHMLDKCYFCLTKTTGFRYSTRDKISYANTAGVVKARLRCDVDNAASPNKRPRKEQTQENAGIGEKAKNANDTARGEASKEISMNRAQLACPVDDAETPSTTSGSTSESDCRVRWKSLRDRYLRECKMKMEEAVDSGSETTEWQWRFFKSLEFLHDHLMPKEKTSNISKKRQHADKLKAESDSELSNSEEYIIDSNEAKVDKLLIKEVRNHKILYVQRHLEFKNDAKRAQAWQSISKSVGFPVSYCQTRWKCLRYRFVKEYRKICHSMDSSSNQILGSQWPFYESMSFLCDHVVPRRKLSYISSLQQAPTVVYELSDDETEPTNVEVLHSEDSLNGTDTLSDLLIEEVKKHEVLYSRKNPYHKNKVKRAEAWVAISNCVGMTELDCQTRWRSMRDRYVRECKKIRNNEITESQWHLFNSMSFLCDQLGPKRKSSSIKKSLQNSVDKFDNAEPNAELLSSQVSEIDNEELESQTHLLIEEVRKHQCLYVKKHPDYKNKVIRADAWASISKCVGMTESECQTRWKSMRDHYVREYKKIHANQITESQYHSFDSMSFLDDQVAVKKIKSRSISEGSDIYNEELEPQSDILLIQEVKKHEFLYVRKHPDHCNRVKRAKAWISISKCVGLTESECSTRWKSMRDRYVREYNKIRFNEISESQWYLFDSMSFISDQVVCKRKSSSFIQQPHDNSVDGTDDDESNTEISKVSEMYNEEPESQSDILLIKEVKKHKLLYVRKHPQYGNKVKRAMAWVSISKSVGMEVSECQTRWKTMRDHFVRDYNKIRGNEITESQWYLFDSMRFLCDQVTPRAIISRSISEGSEIYNEEPEPQSDILLIKEVKKHKLLYIKKHPDHCNSVKRAEAWVSISKGVGMKECYCNRRWKTLRDRYVRNYKKILNNEITECQWNLFHSMSFLCDQVEYRIKSSSFIQESQDNTVDEFDDSEPNAEILISKVSEMYDEDPESQSDILLIEEVKKHELLYARKHGEYCNKVKRAMAWVSISKCVGIPESDCYTRWKSLRDRYVRDYKKICANEITESQWNLFDRLSFLCDHVAPKWILSRPPKKQEALHNFNVKFDEAEPITEDGAEPNTEGSEMYNEESEPMVEVLIEEVKKNKLIYAKDHPDNKNRSKREQAWQTISRSCGLPVHVCKARWKSLRDYYAKEFHQIQDALKEGYQAFESGWYLFKTMDFLRGHATRRKKKEPAPTPVNKEFDNDDELNVEMLITEDSVVDYDDAVAQSPPFYEYIEEQTQQQTPKHESYPNTNWYRKRSSSYNDVLDEFPDEMSATAEKRLCIEAKEAPNDNENTHEGFFLMIRELFKKMPEEDVDDSKIYFLNYLHAKIKKKCS
ncbi:uncharacterized protein LOC106090091 isoform X1 [Stomoxys calcitrans]|uniref:uncharacterized protein LOC106090091 isoform X1 n=1 Tax=Stomoxys calcitrans TaxID=35570 RepID=UPI0027E3AE3B|nr:uncharacterized protein LOC106090091 isoform X1 [Stomoxys calcitrans]